MKILVIWHHMKYLVKFSIWYDELYEEIANQTNLYYLQYIKEKTNKEFYEFDRWHNLYINMIKYYIGILLLLGINYRDNLADHWSSNEYMKSPIAKIISKSKFFFDLEIFPFI